MLVAGGSLQAATRTVCGSVKFKDYRTGCTGNGVDLTGRLDPCSGSTGNEMNIRKTFIEVWDNDPGGTDDYIGKWFVPSRGSFCLTFEWENKSYSMGEANPDVYFRYSDWKWGYGGDFAQLTVEDWDEDTATSAPPPAISWDVTGYRAEECTNGANCWLGGVLLVSTTNDDLAKRFMIGDTGAHTLDVFGDDSSDPRIGNYTALYETEGTGGVSMSATSFKVYDGSAHNMLTTPHEMGHRYIRTLWGDTDYAPHSYTACYPGASHTLVSQECDRVATDEGWCNYIAVRSWWDPENTSSVPYLWNHDFERAVPVYTVGVYTIKDCHTANRGVELAVARGFWDLDDAHQDSSAAPAPVRTDYVNLDSLELAMNWTRFSPGTANRRIGEGYGLTPTDYNGANLWDYWYNGYNYWPNTDYLWVSLLDMQCQYDMDYN